jgi:hypothetical protein
MVKILSSKLLRGINNMKNKISVFGLIFLLFSCPVFAAPTIYGPTGLISIPSAEALQYKEFNVAYDFLTPTTVSGNNVENTYFYKVNIGTYKGWELGVRGGTTPSEGVFVHAKYYLMSDNSRYPVSIAIGLENLSSKTNNTIYLVATKKFQYGFSGTFGFKTDLIQQDSSIMGGVEYFATDQFSLIAEITGERKEYNTNTGFRYYILPELVLRGSYLNLYGSQTNQKGNYYNAGISFSKYF